MKRHLTVLASSAMLAAFAGMAMAADAPVAAPAEAVVAVAPADVVAPAPVVVAPAPVVVAPAPAVAAPAPVIDLLSLDPRNKDKGTTAKLYISGTWDYTIEYNALDKKWNQTTPQSLSYDQAVNLNITVPVGKNKITTTAELAGGTTNWFTTLEAPVLGGTAKLGRIGVNWDGWIADGTDGAGASFDRTFGPLSIGAYTSKTGKTPDTVTKDTYKISEAWVNGGTAGTVALTSGQWYDGEHKTVGADTWLKVYTKTYDTETINRNVSGAKAALDLGNGNNLNAFLVADETKSGHALVTGTYTAGMATLKGRYSVSLPGTTTNDGTALNGRVELKPFDGLTLSAEGWQVDKDYNRDYIYWDPAGRTDNCYDRIAFWLNDWTVDANGIDLKAQGKAVTTYNYADELNYRLRADFTLVKDVASVYGEYFKFANDYTTYGKIGGSNKDIWLSDAFVQFNTDSSNVYNAKFEKDLGGLHYTLEGGMKNATNGVDFKKAYIKAEKQFDIIKLYGLVGSDSFVKDYRVVPKIGAYVYIAF